MHNRSKTFPTNWTVGVAAVALAMLAACSSDSADGEDGNGGNAASGAPYTGGAGYTGGSGAAMAPAGGSGGAPIGGTGGVTPAAGTGGVTPAAGTGGAGGVTPSAGTGGAGGLTPSAGTGGAGGVTPSGGAGGAGGTGADASVPPRGVDAGPVSDAALDAFSADTGEHVPETGTFPAVTDLVAAGPYDPVTVTRSGPGSSYTLYHPAELAPNGVPNPFVTWGNGMGTTPDMYTLLPHLASHGFVIIASNSSTVTPEDLRAGLDWLFDENERQGSEFSGKLDTGKVASMGYSLGSDGTFKIADDPRLTTTVHISGGAFDKADTARLRNPAAFFCGDEGGDGYITGDVAHANCDSDFDVATVPVFYGVFNGGGHLGILMSPYSELIREAVTGWLRWQLMADRTRRAMFVGSDCELCSDPDWTVQQKNLQ